MGVEVGLQVEGVPLMGVGAVGPVVVGVEEDAEGAAGVVSVLCTTDVTTS